MESCSGTDAKYITSSSKGKDQYMLIMVMITGDNVLMEGVLGGWRNLDQERKSVYDGILHTDIQKKWKGF